MFDNKWKVWIESEEWARGKCDINNDNTDVIVEFHNGTRWIASFFTYSNISKLVEKNRRTGEYLRGKYFWSSNMVLVDEISRKRIEEVINYLINEDEFESIFNNCFD
ncbi:hypothetical protein JOC70_000095 [Clostridium pascui]|uniref:hypothetical protein n=1 Tax=Clostridium pascui TaxID=46609 RepID=UPI001958A91D|nr:hypothetical protein [Clostridium pascui]MBM7868626.1 hypothetical protein [Clostridium pascui]